jgi:hypothetical protein
MKKVRMRNEASDDMLFFYNPKIRSQKVRSRAAVPVIAD